MVLIDYAIIAIIGSSCLISLIRGFMREALSLITWGCAFFIACHYYANLAVWLVQLKDEIIRNGVAIALLFISTLFVGTIINFMLSQLVEKAGLSGIDKILGACFGALRGVLIVAIMLLFLDIFTEFPKAKIWQQSQFIPQFNIIFRWFFHYLKDSMSLLPKDLNILLKFRLI